MIVIAADPGLKGAIAALKDGHQLVWLADMPTKEMSNGKLMVCARQLKEMLQAILSEHPKDDHIAIIEQVGTMPGQGIVSAFNFGRGFGVLEASIIARGITLEMVRPAIWKKSLGFTADKEFIRHAMIERFPAFAHMLKRKMDADRAEAIAIALYLWKRDYA